MTIMGFEAYALVYTIWFISVVQLRLNEDYPIK